MARFYNLITHGHVGSVAVLNTHWYRDPRSGLPTSGDLDAVADAWKSQRMPNFLLMLNSTYTLREITVQGYDEQFNRSPYLPHSEPVNQPGGDVTAAGPPILAAVLGCLIEPQVLARRRHPTKGIIETPVRRGYWSISPVNEFMAQPDGTFAGYAQTGTLWGDVAAQWSQPLSLMTFTATIEPVRVSNPLEGETARGWGYVRACAWRRAISTRRSRKVGIGI